MRDVSLSPCCPYHPAGVDDRISQVAIAHAAFVRRKRTQPPESNGFVDRLQEIGFPPSCDPSYGASDSYPGGTTSH